MDLRLLAIRLRRPRPRWRRLACQPGFVACVAAAASLLLCGLASLALLAADNLFIVRQLSIVSYASGMLLLRGGAWLALVLGSRWRADPSWIERMDRSVGVLWISANLFALLRLGLL